MKNIGDIAGRGFGSIPVDPDDDDRDVAPTQYKPPIKEFIEDDDAPFIFAPPIPLFENVAPSKFDPKTMMPPVLSEMCQAIAHVTQTSVEMAMSLCISAVATCIQGKFKITRGAGWKEPGCISVVVGAESGERKSAVLELLIEPLVEWEIEEKERTKEDRYRAKATRSVHQAKQSNLKRKAASEESEDTQKLLIDSMASIESEMPQEVPVPKLFDGDCTAEALQMTLAQYEGRWSVLSDEGGIFRTMGGLYTRGEVNLDTFLKAMSGSRIRVKRMSREVEIENPTLTFGICVQPDILSSLGQKEEFRSTGALARFMFCIPESMIGKRNTRIFDEIPKQIKSNYSNMLKRLLNEKPPTSEPILITLDDEALKAFLGFADYIEDECNEGRSLANIRDWGSKLAGHTLRIAMIFHLAGSHEYTPPVVNKTTMQMALDFSYSLISHALYAFSTMAGDATIGDAKELLRWMVKHGQTTYTKRDLYRVARFSNSTEERLFEALKVLLDRNIVAGPFVKKGTRGRKSFYFKMNPEVMKKGAVDGLVDL